MEEMAVLVGKEEMVEAMAVAVDCNQNTHTHTHIYIYILTRKL